MPRMSRTARDAGLRQVSNATRWIAGLAAVLTAVFATWEARSAHAGATTPARPGGANGTPTVSQPPSDTGAGGSGFGDAGSNDLGQDDPGYNDPGYNDPGYNDPGLQAPDAGPTFSDRTPVASSGGS